MSIQTTEPVFEFEDLCSRCLGNLSLIERALEAFGDEFPSEIDRLECACKANQIEDIATLAHRMKGSASNVAALAITKELDFIESAVCRHDMQEVTRACDRLRNEWRRFAEAVA